MILLSQRDKRWAGKPLGKSKFLVGDYGCTITAISMATSWAGKFLDPAFLAKYLTFNAEGSLIWSSISEKTCFNFIWREFKYNEKMICDAIKASTDVCLLELTDFFTGGPKEKHWVLATMRIPFYGYWVADPWSGQKKMVKTSLVSGCAILRKK